MTTITAEMVEECFKEISVEARKGIVAIMANFLDIRNFGEGSMFELLAALYNAGFLPKNSKAAKERRKEFYQKYG